MTEGSHMGDNRPMHRVQQSPEASERVLPDQMARVGVARERGGGLTRRRCGAIACRAVCSGRQHRVQLSKKGRALGCCNQRGDACLPCSRQEKGVPRLLVRHHVAHDV